MIQNFNDLATVAQEVGGVTGEGVDGEDVTMAIITIITMVTTILIT